MENKDTFEEENFEEFEEENKLPQPKPSPDGEYYEDRTEEQEKKENDFTDFDKDGFSDNRNEGGSLFEQARYDDIFDKNNPKTRGWSIASFVLGIISVISCCSSYLAVILGVLAIIFSIISRKNLKYFDGLSIAGLILGIFGVVFGMSVIVAMGSLLDAFFEAIENGEFVMPEDGTGINGGF